MVTVVKYLLLVRITPQIFLELELEESCFYLYIKYMGKRFRLYKAANTNSTSNTNRKYRVFLQQYEDLGVICAF